MRNAKLSVGALLHSNGQLIAKPFYQKTTQLAFSLAQTSRCFTVFD